MGLCLWPYGGEGERVRRGRGHHPDRRVLHFGEEVRYSRHVLERVRVFVSRPRFDKHVLQAVRVLVPLDRFKLFPLRSKAAPSNTSVRANAQPSRYNRMLTPESCLQERGGHPSKSWLPTVTYVNRD